MLLEMENSELLQLLKTGALLTERVSAAFEVLQQQNGQHSGGSPAGAAAGPMEALPSQLSTLSTQQIEGLIQQCRGSAQPQHQQLVAILSQQLAARQNAALSAAAAAVKPGSTFTSSRISLLLFFITLSVSSEYYSYIFLF